MDNLIKAGEMERTTGEMPRLPAAPTPPRVAGCATCRGMRWVKWYWPPEGAHTRHDARCERKYGFCLHPCPTCAMGIRAGRVSPERYTWLGDEAGDLPAKTLAAFDKRWQPHASARSQDWLAEVTANSTPLHNLIFAGPPGTGKTHLVAALVNALTDAGIACLFASAPAYFEAHYAANFEEKERLMRMASEIAVLVLDDLDKVYVKPDGEYQKKQFYAMLNRRYVAQKPTLITTNAEGTLKTWLDGATISRLFERMWLVPMQPGDYRQKGRAT